MCVTTTHPFENKQPQTVFPSRVFHFFFLHWAADQNNQALPVQPLQHKSLENVVTFKKVLDEKVQSFQLSHVVFFREVLVGLSGVLGENLNTSKNLGKKLQISQNVPKQSS